MSLIRAIVTLFSAKSAKLQKVEVPILNNTICAKWYSEAYNGYVQIHDYQICAGYKEGGKDACKVCVIQILLPNFNFVELFPSYCIA